MSETTTPLARFTHQHTVLLTTYRRNGTPVGTPVNIAVEGDHGFIRSYATAGKMKRIRNNPVVEVAPSTFGGKVTGPGLRGRVRILSGAEAAHAARLIARKHPILQGILVPLLHRLTRKQTVHLAFTPLAEAAAEPGPAASPARAAANGGA